MKNLYILAILLLNFSTISCSKSDPGGGSNNPPVIAKPVLNIQNPEPAWFKSTISIPYGVTSSLAGDALKLYINGVPQDNLSGVYTIVQATLPSYALIFEAKGNGGSVKDTVNAQVYPDEVTKACYTSPGNTGIWRFVSGRYRTPSGAWLPYGVPLCQPTKFFPNGLCTNYNEECGTGLPNTSGSVWYFSNNYQTIRWNGEDYNLLSLTSNTLVRSFQSNGNYHEETFQKY